MAAVAVVGAFGGSAISVGAVCLGLPPAAGSALCCACQGLCAISQAAQSCGPPFVLSPLMLLDDDPYQTISKAYDTKDAHVAMKIYRDMAKKKLEKEKLKLKAKHTREMNRVKFNFVAVTQR